MNQPSLHVTTVCTTLFYLNDMNVYLLEPDSSIYVALERSPLPEFLNNIQQRDFSNLWEEANKPTDGCYLYTNELGLSYLAGLLEVEEEPARLLVQGPFLKQTPDTKKLQACYSVDQQKQIVLEEFFRGLKLVNRSKLRSIANILPHLCLLHNTPLHTIDRLQPEAPAHQDTSDSYSALKQPDEKYTDLINMRYAAEKELMLAVERGEKERLREIMLKSEGMFDFSDRLPNQPVRVLKNSLIIINTLLRIAAGRSLVPPFFLHHISEKFSIQIERIRSIDALHKQMLIMCDEYCDLVRSRSAAGYSMLVQEAVSYLTIHFSHPFKLTELARRCSVHPAHLSRQFKKETGMTLTDYLNKLRVEEAKIWLRKDRTPVDWIAGYTGYEDAGYFTRIFKKIEGMTPSEYRNSK